MDWSGGQGPQLAGGGRQIDRRNEEDGMNVGTHDSAGEVANADADEAQERGESTGDGEQVDEEGDGEERVGVDVHGADTRNAIHRGPTTEMQDAIHLRNDMSAQLGEARRLRVLEMAGREIIETDTKRQKECAPKRAAECGESEREPKRGRQNEDGMDHANWEACWVTSNDDIDDGLTDEEIREAKEKELESFEQHEVHEPISQAEYEALPGPPVIVPVKWVIRKKADGGIKARRSY